MHSLEQTVNGETCTTCKKQYKTLELLKKHEKLHNPVCDKCLEVFKNIKLLRLHTKEKHPKTKKYKCKVCSNLSFTREKEFLMHIREDHEGKIIESHMCSVCGKTFRTSSELKLHMKSKCGTEKKYICKECGQKLMSPGSLYTHLKRHRGEITFMCRFCAKLFLTSGQLKVHERKHTQQKVFVCDDCGKGFCHRQSLITHISVHTGIKPYQCEGCGKSFSCVGNLLKHRKCHEDSCGSIPMTSHRVQNPSTKIKVKINTPTSSKLKRAQMKAELYSKFAMLDNGLGSSEDQINVDVRNDSGEGSKKTEKSTVTTVGNTNLENTTDLNNLNQGKSDTEIFNGGKEEFVQQTTISQQTEKKIFEEYVNKQKSEREKNHDEFANHRKLPQKCTCCKLSLETKLEVKDHQQQVHTDVLACHDCGDKIFSNMDSLRSHQQNFHKGNPRKGYIYICDKCGKEFKQKALLKMHESSHCGAPSTLQCNICHKEFSTHHTLKTHMRIHTSEKTLSCKFCSKSFHWKGQLKVHERSHTGEKPYSCLFCPSAFAYRDSLITHSTMHTGIKPYLCKCCGWRFSCQGNLAKHKVTHTSTCGTWYNENVNE